MLGQFRSAWFILHHICILLEQGFKVRSGLCPPDNCSPKVGVEVLAAFDWSSYTGMSSASSSVVPKLATATGSCHFLNTLKDLKRAYMCTNRKRNIDDVM